MDISLKEQLKQSGYTGEFDLASLIEACGDGFGSITRSPRNTWYATEVKGKGKFEHEIVVGDEYPTPEEAVAKLWLASNKNGK